jgi:hypothetical protein
MHCSSAIPVHSPEGWGSGQTDCLAWVCWDAGRQSKMVETESLSDSLLAGVQIYSDKPLVCVLLSGQSGEPDLRVCVSIGEESSIKGWEKAWESLGGNVVRLILCLIYYLAATLSLSGPSQKQIGWYPYTLSYQLSIIPCDVIIYWLYAERIYEVDFSLKSDSGKVSGGCLHCRKTFIL